MLTGTMPMRLGNSLWRTASVLAALALGLAGPGCAPPGRWGQGRPGAGTQDRPLRLTPSQELSLGRQAYAKITQEARAKGVLLPESDRRVARVRKVGEKIKKAALIKPLAKEIKHSIPNYDVADYHYDWNFSVIESPQVNAFCLPGCEIVVYTGLLEVATNDDQLAAVLGHEVGHALAHHANERLAREGRFNQALAAVGGKDLDRLDPRSQERLIGLLAGGFNLSSAKHFFDSLNSRAFDRKQETEADHIGIFFMKFAGYDPEQALVFWEKMKRISDRRPHPPAILSTHPSDAQRINQIRRWIPYANAAYEAYEKGDVAPG